jgi:hypothetical protein
MADGDAMATVLQSNSHTQALQQRCVEEKNFFFFFLFDATLSFGNFKSLQGFLRLLLCLCMKKSVLSSPLMLQHAHKRLSLL